MWPLLPMVLALALSGAQGRLGIVVDDREGRPLEGVRLSLEGCTTRELPTALEVGFDGLFQIPEYKGGSCRYRVTRDGYVPMSFSVHSSDGEPLQVRLAALGWITGTVSDSQGEPVRSAVVMALRGKTLIAVPQPGQRAVDGHRVLTDARGRFRLYNLVPGEYVVGVVVPATADGSGPSFTLHPEDHRPQRIAIRPGVGIDNVAITLRPALSRHSVSGKVVFSNGNPLPASVFITRRDQPWVSLSTTQALQDGSFRFESLPSGSYDVYAIAPSSGLGEFNTGFLSNRRQYARCRVQIDGGDEPEATLLLEPAGTVSIALKCAEQSGCQKCLSAATVTVSSLVPWGHSGAPISAQLKLTDSQNFSGITPGPNRVSVSGLGESCFHVGAGMDSVLDGGSADPANVMLSSGATLQVKIKKGHDPQPRRIAVFVLAREAQFGDSVATFDAGSSDDVFTFTDLRPGRYRVSVRDAKDVSRKGWSATTDSWPEIDLKTGPNEIELSPLPGVDK